MQDAIDHYIKINLEQAALIKDLLGQIEVLKMQMQQMQKMIFGSKHERFVPDSNPQQLSLNINTGAIEQSSVISAKKITYTRTSSLKENTSAVHPGRLKLPDHLERREEIIEPADLTEGCRRLGEEITELLECEPAVLYVRKLVRPRYVTADNNFIIAELPERPLPKSMAGASLLAQIVIDKYVDHLPLYRQQQRFTRQQVNIPYSTITDWVSGTCNLLTPLYEALRREVLATDYLHADESPIKVLDRSKKGETHRGYYWVYHNSLNGMVLFDYQPGRGREGPKEVLKDYKGFLQTDGYKVYDIFDQRKEITQLCCWAHARRYFFEAQKNDPQRSGYALSRIQQLYSIEKRAGEMQSEVAEILSIREKKSIPVLNELKQWMQQSYPEVLPQSPIGKAIAYSLKRWDQLMVYTTDGKLNIDNNPVENSIRPLAVGRKNYLFAGSHEAAQRSAMLYSIMGTCKLNGINPLIYLTDILKRINTHKIKQITDLLPQHWKPIQ